jgi:hypothetical protein
MQQKALVVSIVLFSLTVVGSAARAQSSNQTPEGFSGLGVFVADGEFVPGSPNPDVPGCDLIPAFCDINYFFEEVVHFTPEEQEAGLAAAKEFILERFGLDVDALIAAGEITWVEGYADPRINYRARVLPNQRIHRLGWEVHDMSFLLIANVELELGGEFAGTAIPPGSLITKGMYVIQKSELIEHDGHTVLVNLPQKIVIRFQSGAPILASADTRAPIVANCELTSSPWGAGVAVVGSFPFQGTELLKQGVRNLLTFDGGEGLGGYVGVYNDPDLIIMEP